MPVVELSKPIKTPERYEFRYLIRDRGLDRPELVHRIRSLGAGYGGLFRSTYRFGFKIRGGLKLNHHEIWDSIYPLCFMTRNGGPAFNRGDNELTLRVPYPILTVVRDFYVRRAADFGMTLHVEAETYDKTFEIPTSGRALAFGGGKDSRLLLGCLRELGHNDVTIFTTGNGNTPDLPDARIFRGFAGVLVDRLFPALMSLPRHFYFGGGLGEIALETPWQQYYDWASARVLDGFSDLLRSLGVEMTLESPASVLPYNIIQNILARRYPELYRYQISVPPHQCCEKNLHISLLKLYHGLEFQDQLTYAEMRPLLKGFVEDQLAHPDDFGHNRHREIINREMRGVIYRRREHEVFSEIAERIGPDWDAPWIDYIHGYVNPGVDPGFMNIFRQYAEDIAQAPEPLNSFAFRC